jgi:hypothetical protein
MLTPRDGNAGGDDRVFEIGDVFRRFFAKVCQKKGCFFVAQHEADTVRVTFKDYGFFIPTDSGGKTVLLAGNFQRKALSREEAEHLAEDLGEEAPKDVPDFEYAIVATGVSIPRG